MVLLELQHLYTSNQAPLHHHVQVADCLCSRRKAFHRLVYNARQNWNVLFHIVARNHYDDGVYDDEEEEYAELYAAEEYAQGYAEKDTEGYAQGYAEKDTEGYDQGYAEKDTEGYAENYTEGYAENYTEGYADEYCSHHY